MALSGKHLIGGEWQGEVHGGFHAIDPLTGNVLPTAFTEGGVAEVSAALACACEAFAVYRHTSPAVRAELLEKIAEQMLASADDIIAQAHQETALPRPRLEGELQRTTGQLKQFAKLLTDARHLSTRIDVALPNRTPQPRPDLRMTYLPLGPVAVFGASNFPLAFSVAGGDSAAALAAGCPVVVKGHPGHPGTSELVARAVHEALQLCALPAGCFALIQGQRPELGVALVQAAKLKAVAFTGSLAVGRSLFDLAAKRPEPIPVFAEMGSVNPIFLLPKKLSQAARGLASGYAESLCLGVGQFCTNPGVVIAQRGRDFDLFQQTLCEQLRRQPAAAMLHAGIKDNYLSGMTAMRQIPGVELLCAAACEPQAGCLVRPALMKVTAETFLREPALADEVFGPSALLVECASFGQMLEIAASLPGQLTATLQATGDEQDECRKLLDELELKAGRLIFNGFPTGVEVCDAMVHGGPYPATTDSRSSSVGTLAIERFLRPVCYQNFSNPLLPEELRTT